MRGESLVESQISPRITLVDLWAPRPPTPAISLVAATEPHPQRQRGGAATLQHHTCAGRARSPRAAHRAPPERQTGGRHDDVTGAAPESGVAEKGYCVSVLDPLRALLAQDRLDEFVDLSVERFSEIYNGPWREYADLVATIDRSDLVRFPEVMVISSAASSWFEPHTALGWARIEHAVDLMKAIEVMRAHAAEETDPRRRLRSAGVELGAHRILSRSADAAIAAERWEALVDELPPQALLASAETVHVFGTQVVAAYAQEGRFPDAMRAAVRMNDDVSVWRRMHVGGMVAMSQALFGDIPSARRTLDRLEHELEGLDVRSRYGATGWGIAAALVAVEDGDGERAHARLDELDERLSSVDHWAYVLAARGRALQLTHSADEAADILHELITEHRGRRASEFALDLLTSVSGDLLVAAGQTERARTLLQDASGTGPSALAHSRALLRNDAPAARRRAAVALAQHEQSPRLTTEALLTMVIAAARLGLTDEARRMMSRLAGSLKRRGNVSVLRFAPRSELLALIPPDDSEMVSRVQAMPEDHDAGIGRPAVLTASELRVLGALLDEPGARAVAERLYLSQNTVKTHLRNAYRKLGATDRASALALATRHGLLD